LRFWDSSALVPLIVTQDASALADEWLTEDANVAVWTLSGVELVSAVMRLRREGRLEEAQVNAARINRLPRLLAVPGIGISAAVTPDGFRSPQRRSTI